MMKRIHKTNRRRFPLFSLLISLSPFLFTLFSFPACSSAPKRPAEVFIIRNTAVNQLTLANHNAGQGRYEDAMIILEDAWRLVLSIDDPSLRMQTTISRGSILFSMGRHEEAFLAWESAALEGDMTRSRQYDMAALAALARINIIRARLVLLGIENPEGSDAADTAAEELKANLLLELQAVRNDPSSTAQAYETLGLAEKQLRRWPEAEAAIRRALSIHERNRSLENAAYDWFLIASIRSVAGNYEGAMQALMAAIRFDRRAENGFGLASSWQAIGAVHEKAGRPEESRTAYRRAAEIYRAIGLNEMAQRLQDKY